MERSKPAFAQPRHATLAPPPAEAVPLRVLVVDGRPGDCELLVQELCRAGFAVEWWRVDAEADYHARLTPGLDLILFDCTLPHFTAHRALQLTRDRGLDIPLIAVSETVDEEVAGSLTRSGATGYLPKDRLAKLGQVVEKALAERRLRQEKKQADENFRVSEERYRSLFEGVPVGLYRATPEGIILDVNPSFLRMLVYPNRETLAAVNAASLYVDPGARQQWLTLLEREGVVSDFESELRRYDGTTIWVRASARAVRNVHGRTSYFEGAVVDITERKMAEEEIRHRVAELEALYDLSKRLRKARDPEEMYPILLEHAVRLLQADHGTLAFLNVHRQTFTRVYTAGAAAETHPSTFPVAGTLPGHVVESEAAFVTADLASTLPTWLDTARYQHLGPVAIVPVQSEQEIIGTLGVGRVKRIGQRPFIDREVRMLEGIAEIGGTAIRRARLHQNLQQAYIQMVLALAQTIESRDSYTANHSERMTLMAERIAREMRCSDEEIQDVRWGARLHDIGKIGVPDAILNKPMALTEAEWKMMREHPVLGEEILRSVERMRGVGKLVRHHQERWDGTGYPDGLWGEQIPLGARILAVVDAYGAITEARPYKSARSHKQAVAEIRRCAGTQFDPRVVDVFCRVIEGALAGGHQLPDHRA